MLPFSNPLSDSILSFGHDDLGHAVDPDPTGDHLQRGQYAGLLNGPQGADRLGLGQAQCTKERPGARRSHAGAVLEEREHSDFSCDATLIVEYIDGAISPALRRSLSAARSRRTSTERSRPWSDICFE